MTHGERNPRATLTDDDVDMIRDLWEADRFKPRAVRHWTVARLSEKFEVSKRHVYNIVLYLQRVSTLDDE